MLLDGRAQEWIGRAMKMKERMLKIADSIPIKEELALYFPRDVGISYRQLTIELQHRGGPCSSTWWLGWAGGSSDCTVGGPIGSRGTTALK